MAHAQKIPLPLKMARGRKIRTSYQALIFRPRAIFNGRECFERAPFSMEEPACRLDSVQCETISLIKFQPSHGAVDFLGKYGRFCWENPNPDSCFYSVF